MVSARGRESIAILDFGSQYSYLIARRVREQHVYCELLPHDAPVERIEALSPRGFILSGGPSSVYDKGAPLLPEYVLNAGLPILGICYGMQLLAYHLGGEVAPSGQREYGPAELQFAEEPSSLFLGLPSTTSVWMSHGDRIMRLPPGFTSMAHTDNSPYGAMGNPAKKAYGLQFHPEVVHTPHGPDIIRNYLFNVCGCKGDWSSRSFVQEAVASVRDQVGDGRVICAVSGGVDSTVTAALVQRAIGDRFTAIFVDTGLLRLGEVERNIEFFRRDLGLETIFVDARQDFLGALEGITDPEEKRRLIGHTFIDIFEAEAGKLGRVDFLAQGTLYPDVIESAGTGGKATARIKSHHNVGGLPDHMHLKLVEPLRHLFKDEVRRIGLELGLPPDAVYRQPFPGPGLAVRIIGEVTEERLHTLQLADAIVREEIKTAGLHREVWQYFAVLTPLRSVGVMGDNRTYANVVAIRAVTAEDAMTADWARLPYDLLARISNRIVNEVSGVNRVVYDISSKPPATIEWE